MLRALPLIIFAAVAPSSAFAGGSDGFVRGERWTCVTDKGADAFMTISEVQDGTVSFAYGILNAKTNAIDPLCHMRLALDYQETLEFCRLIGAEGSDAHSRLEAECAKRAEK